MFSYRQHVEEVAGTKRQVRVQSEEEILDKENRFQGSMITTSRCPCGRKDNMWHKMSREQLLVIMNGQQQQDRSAQ